MSKFLFAPLLTVAACASTGQYVANIRAVPRGIEVQKCSFDDRGKADTGICQTETVMIRAVAAPQPPAAPPGYLQPGVPPGRRKRRETARVPVPFRAWNARPRWQGGRGPSC